MDRYVPLEQVECASVHTSQLDHMNHFTAPKMNNCPAQMRGVGARERGEDRVRGGEKKVNKDIFTERECKRGKRV